MIVEVCELIHFYSVKHMLIKAGGVLRLLCNTDNMIMLFVGDCRLCVYCCVLCVRAGCPIFFFLMGSIMSVSCYECIWFNGSSGGNPVAVPVSL